MENKEAIYLFLRYFILLIFGIFISVFYIAFKPLTVYPVYFLLKLFIPVTLASSTLLTSTVGINLIPACIAGAAYYLLLVFNLTTPMELNRRVKSLIFVFIVFLIVNIIRILIIVQLAISNSVHLDLTHKLLWYLGSTLAVVMVWFASVFIFKIKAIPVYTDIKSLIKTA